MATTTASTKTPAEVEKSKRSLDALRAQRAWDLAIGPAKSVPMQVCSASCHAAIAGLQAPKPHFGRADGSGCLVARAS